MELLTITVSTFLSFVDICKIVGDHCLNVLFLNRHACVVFVREQTRCVSYKKHEVLTPQEHKFLVWSVLLIFIVFCVVFYVLFVFDLCLVPYVASVSWWSIIDCPFGFLLWLFVLYLVPYVACVTGYCLLLIAPLIFSNGYLLCVLLPMLLVSLDIIQLWPSGQFLIFTDSEGRNCFIIPNKQLKYTV